MKLRRSAGGWRFAKQDDAVRVRALAVVRHAPAVGGLGEDLGVDQHEHRLEAGGDARRESPLPRAARAPPRTSPTSNATWPPGRSERRTSHSVRSTNACHTSTCFALRHRHGGRVDAAEPASQPVVGLVIDHVEKRRRGDGERDAAGRRWPACRVDAPTTSCASRASAASVGLRPRHVRSSEPALGQNDLRRRRAAAASDPAAR